MRREDLEHVVGAAANVAGEDEFVVVGSQAILGLVKCDELLARLPALPVEAQQRSHVASMLGRMIEALSGSKRNRE